MKQVTIRSIQNTDYPEMMKIDQLVFNSTTTPATMRQKTLEEYSRHYSPDRVFIAELEGKVAGYIGYDNPTGLASNNHVMEIYIAVHPDYQKMGVGRELTNFIISWGKQNGYKKISLRVLSSNQKAIAFYHKLGFLEQGRLVNEFILDGNYVDDIMMYQFL
jgi:ribosomal protein S18 acetylase RimI-like enzyme